MAVISHVIGTIEVEYTQNVGQPLWFDSSCAIAQIEVLAEGRPRREDFDSTASVCVVIG